MKKIIKINKIYAGSLVYLKTNWPTFSFALLLSCTFKILLLLWDMLLLLPPSVSLNYNRNNESVIKKSKEKVG